MNWTAVSVTLSLLVGLSLARVLTGLVALFRARHRATLDWVPVAWSMVLLLTLLESWTALSGLAQLLPSVSFRGYLALAGLMILLFASASLILPPGELAAGDDLRRHFREEGRYALPLYSAFLAAGAAVNLVFFGAPAMAVWLPLDIVMMAVPVVAFAAGRRVQEVATAAFLPVFALDIYLALATAGP